jgi:hypothetical protein
LESILVKYNESGDCGGVDVNKKMHKYQKHEPFSIAIIKCSYDDTLSKFNLYTSKDCQNWFVQKLKAIALEFRGVFPYENLDNWDKLHDNCLPERQAFYSKINDSEISSDDYDHACNVWRTFKINTLQEYAELYLTTDVLLLADIFENFRTTCRNTYQLDCLHYYTIPGYSFDAMLKHTGVKLELLTDVEKGIRGGISQCSNPYAKANNKYRVTDEKPLMLYLAYFLSDLNK